MILSLPRIGSRPFIGNGSLGVPFPLTKCELIPTFKTMMHQNWRTPWDKLPMQFPSIFNYHFTINPDPKCSWITNNDCRCRKTHHKQLREFLSDAYNQKLFSNTCIVYEYGKYGKKFGKLHYHCLFRTAKAKKLQQCAFRYFKHTSTKSDRSCVYKMISHSLKKDTLNLSWYNSLKKCSLLESKRYIYNNYFRKENHNKIKCLTYWYKK